MSEAVAAVGDSTEGLQKLSPELPHDTAVPLLSLYSPKQGLREMFERPRPQQRFSQEP